jgi:uncharacterized protein YybS (DUF2232 family)
MVERREEKAGQEARIGMAILIAVFSLPAINPDMTGWLCGLVPLPVFYYLIYLGKDQGFTIIRNAILLSGGIALIFGSLPLLIFSLTLVPLGFVFFQSAQQKKTPAQTGLNGILVLGAAWLLFWTGYGVIRHINPYQELLSALDEGLTLAFGMYLEQSELPANAITNFEIAIEQLRIFLPRVMPALLTTGILYTVWMNQALGNWLLKKREESLAPWQDFQKWQLPDNLVWGLIFGGASLFLASPLTTLGLNIIVILGAVYFLQGLAVLISFLHKWGLPMPLRILIYAFMFIQSIGVIALALLGLTDTWADYRKLNPKPEKPANLNDTEGN